MSAVIVLELILSFKKNQFVLKNQVYECPSISKGLLTFSLILHLQHTFIVMFFGGMSYLSLQNVKRSRLLNIALLDNFVSVDSIMSIISRDN